MEGTDDHHIECANLQSMRNLQTRCTPCVHWMVRYTINQDTMQMSRSNQVVMPSLHEENVSHTKAQTWRLMGRS